MNRAGRLGSDHETQSVNFLKSLYPLAERRKTEGRNDRGDVAGTPHTWEMKNTKDIDLSGGMNELEKEIANAGTDYGFLIVKRRRKSIGDAYAVMSFKQLLEILRKLEGSDD